MCVSADGTGGGGGYIGAGVLLCSCDSGAIISSEYKTVHYWVYFRETRERLPPADCWSKWGLNEYKWKGFFFGWFTGLFLQVEKIVVLLLSRKYFFSLSYTISIHLSPSPSILGRQSCRVAWLLMCVSGVHWPATTKNGENKDDLSHSPLRFSLFHTLTETDRHTDRQTDRWTDGKWNCIGSKGERCEWHDRSRSGK